MTQISLFSELYPACALVIFDGECSLCDGFIRFCHAHEKNSELFFSSLQSPLGQAILKEIGLSTDTLTTIILVVDAEVFLQSEAALRISSYLRPPYSYVASLRIIPLIIRDSVYSFVSQHRHTLFKSKAKDFFCEAPPLDLKKRILSDIFP